MARKRPGTSETTETIASVDSPPLLADPFYRHRSRGFVTRRVEEIGGFVENQFSRFRSL